MTSPAPRRWFVALAIAAWVTAQFLLSTGAEAAERAHWQWPVQPAPGSVTRMFDDPGPYAPGHRGIDVDAAPGQAIFAVADGVVRFAGSVAGRPVISVQHADGLISTYEPVVAAVAAGDAVTAGQQLGALDALTKHAPSSGLHLGARIGTQYLDPLALLGAIPRAILLPLGTVAYAHAAAVPLMSAELSRSRTPFASPHRPSRNFHTEHFHTEQEPS